MTPTEIAELKATTWEAAAMECCRSAAVVQSDLLLADCAGDTRAVAGFSAAKAALLAQAEAFHSFAADAREKVEGQ